MDAKMARKKAEKRIVIATAKAEKAAKQKKQNFRYLGLIIFILLAVLIWQIAKPPPVAPAASGPTAQVAAVTEKTQPALPEQIPAAGEEVETVVERATPPEPEIVSKAPVSPQPPPAVVEDGVAKVEVPEVEEPEVVVEIEQPEIAVDIPAPEVAKEGDEELIAEQELEIDFPEGDPVSSELVKLAFSDEESKGVEVSQVIPPSTGSLRLILMANAKVLPTAIQNKIAVSVDGKSVSFNGGVISELDGGQHNVEVSHRDFKTWRGTVVVSPSESNESVVDLTPKMTQVKLVIVPTTDYDVTVNGRQFYVEEGRIELPTGIPVDIEIEAPPFRKHRESLRLSAGERREIEVKLTPDVPAMSELDEETKIYRRPNPSYPTKLWKDGITGVVELQFVVSKLGTVDEVWVMNSAHPDIAKACVLAMEDWRFEPGKWGDSLTRYYASEVFEFPPKGRALWNQMTLDSTASGSTTNVQPPEPLNTAMPHYPAKQYKWLGGISDLIAPGSIPRSLLRTFNFEIWKLKCLGACPEDLYLMSRSPSTIRAPLNPTRSRSRPIRVLTKRSQASLRDGALSPPNRMVFP